MNEKQIPQDSKGSGNFTKAEKAVISCILAFTFLAIVLVAGLQLSRPLASDQDRRYVIEHRCVKDRISPAEIEVYRGEEIKRPASDHYTCPNGATLYIDQE